MLRPDLIRRVTRAHDAAVDAAARWNYAAGAKHKAETFHDRYVRAEERFDAAMAALVDDGKRRR